MTASPAKPLRPRSPRPVWITGLQYAGETPEAMAAREAVLRSADAAADAEEARLWRWKLTPWWLLD